MAQTFAKPAAPRGIASKIAAPIDRTLSGPEEDQRFCHREVQLGEFLDAVRRRPNTFPAFAVMAPTGLRLGEAAALRWEDVDWRTARLSVARQLTGSLKTPESERQVDLPRGLLELTSAPS